MPMTSAQLSNPSDERFFSFALEQHQLKRSS
jgi:hypothetical protein